VRRARRSTLGLAALFLTALVTYLFVRPEVPEAGAVVPVVATVPESSPSPSPTPTPDPTPSPSEDPEPTPTPEVEPSPTGVPSAEPTTAPSTPPLVDTPTAEPSP
jgi:outer membrane biosynthesis protein TonB